MDKNNKTVSREPFFNDIMQGFEEASAFPGRAAVSGPQRVQAEEPCGL